MSVFLPTGPAGQLANLSFFLAALVSDVLLIRLFLVLAYLWLTVCECLNVRQLLLLVRELPARCAEAAAACFDVQGNFCSASIPDSSTWFVFPDLLTVRLPTSFHLAVGLDI